jgi:heptosyltransferase-2
VSALPKRLLIVCPSWIGDVVMATPTLRRLRSALPGAFIGGLARPGMDELLAGTDFFDELHIDRAAGVMGPKLVAAKLRPRRYDAAALLTNSFSTALITRLAFIPRRIGYDRDGRGLLLTDRLKPDRRADGRAGWACVPAVDYYLRIAESVLDGAAANRAAPPRLELATTPAQEQAADRILHAAGLVSTDNEPLADAVPPFAILNPGANNEAKRWPAQRFGELAAYLVRMHNLRVLINGSPSEADLAADVRSHALQAAPTAAGSIACLPRLGGTIGSLKALLRRGSLLVTNDTGPRHIAAAFNVPTITLFGPTDPRWTMLPPSGAHTRTDLLADPSLPPDEIADDHPERCRIDRITLDRVTEAADALLALRHAGSASGRSIPGGSPQVDSRP